MVKRRGLTALLAQAGNPISRAPQRLKDLPITVDRNRSLELETLLHLRDGFRALGGALIVRPTVDVASARGLEGWNSITLWRAPYRPASKLYFFADDIHGRQFALHRDEIVLFDPETGDFTHYAHTLDEWAGNAVADPDALGAARIRAWETGHAPLRVEERLQPALPACMGGLDGATADIADDFRVLGDVELMRRYARLFREKLAGEVDVAQLVDWW